MLRWIVPALVIACLMTTTPALAAPGPMTLPDAVAYALTHNSTVATQIANVTQAQHQYALQSEIAYPTVNGTLQSFLSKSANLEGQYAAIGAVQQSEVSQNTASVGITNWNLTTGGFSFLTLAAVRSQIEQAQNTLANTEDQIATNVTNSYYGIVARKAIVDVDVVTLNYQNVLVNVAKAREKAGAAAGVDVLQAQTSAAKSESALVADRASVVDASEALAQQIGAPIQTPFVLPAAVPEPPLPQGTIDTLVGIAEVNRPDVEAARDAVLAATYTRKGWNVELYPQVSISAALGNQFSPVPRPYELTPLGLPVLVNGQPVYQHGSAGFWSLQAISTFTLPLIDYNARHSERVNDEALLTSAKSTFSQTRLQAELDVRQSYRAAQTAQSQLMWAKEEAATGTESARIAQLQYKVGVKSIYDVLQAQQAAAQAVYDLVNARVSYVEAIVKLRVALGTFSAQSAVAGLQ
jgi:outer membrane protein TolC